MWDNYVGQKIRECNQNLLLSLIPSTAVGVFLAWLAFASHGEAGSFVQMLIILGAVVLLSVSLRNLYAWSARRRHPEKHPVVLELTKYGEPAEVASHISAEYTSRDAIRIGGYAVTRTWMLHESAYGFHMVRLSEVVWHYEHEIKVYRGQQLPGQLVEVKYEVVVRTSAGKEIRLDGVSEQNARLLMLGILVHNPKALAGYDEELDKKWKIDAAGTAKALVAGQVLPGAEGAGKPRAEPESEEERPLLERDMDADSLAEYLKAKLPDRGGSGRHGYEGLAGELRQAGYVRIAALDRRLPDVLSAVTEIESTRPRYDRPGEKYSQEGAVRIGLCHADESFRRIADPSATLFGPYKDSPEGGADGR